MADLTGFQKFKANARAILTNVWVSWKTSILGVVTFLFTNGTDILNYLNNHGGLDSKTFWLGFGTMLIGLLSRDGDKTSEQAGAGNTGPNQPK